MTRRKTSGRWLWATLVVVYSLMAADSVAQIVRAATPWGGVVLLGVSFLFAVLSAAGYRQFARPEMSAHTPPTSRVEASTDDNTLVAALDRDRRFPDGDAFRKFEL